MTQLDALLACLPYIRKIVRTIRRTANRNRLVKVELIEA